MEEQNKVYIYPGNVVRVIHLEDAPKMVVNKILKTQMAFGKNGIEEKTYLKGVECYWFTEAGEYQIAEFNTKDLEILDSRGYTEKQNS